MVRKDLLILLTNTFTLFFQFVVVFLATEADGSNNNRQRSHFSNLTNRLKQDSRLIKEITRNNVNDGKFVRKTFYNNLAKKRRRNGSNLRWNSTWADKSGVNTKDIIDNSTNSQPHQDPLYHEFVIPFRVRRFFNISTKEKRKIRRKKKRKYKGVRRKLIKSYRKNFKPFIETMFILQQSTPGKIFEEYMYSNGQVANSKNTKLKSQVYQRSNLPARDLIMPSYPMQQDNGMTGGYPGGVQLINVVPGGGYQQQANNVGPLETAISELTHALDRQQVSGEMQQLTNTMAQTMLNTLILSNEFHH